MSDIDFGVGISGAGEVSVALRQVGTALGGLTSQQQQQTGAARANATANASATSSLRSFSQQAQQGAQRIQGVAGAAQQLVSVMGSENRSASVIGSVAGATAQFAALGSMFGPIGTAVGAVTGLVAGLASAFNTSTAAVNDSTEAERDLRSELERNAEVYSRYESAIRSATRARHEESLVEFGVATPEAYAARLQAIQEQIDAQERLRTASDEGRAAREREIESLVDSRETVNESGESIADLASRADHFNSVSRNATAEVVRLREELAALQATAAAASLEEQEVMVESLVESATPAATPRRGGGGGRRAPREEPRAAMTEEALAASTTIISEREEARRARVDEARFGEVINAINEEAAAHYEALRVKEDAATEATREHAEAQRELAEAAREASAAFSDGYTASIDDVVAAYRNANTALRASGQSMISQARLMERAMVATGNNISETVGGTMVGAFENALGAWLDGSKTFVEAAEDMVKGVLKALTIESIVQAVTEVARSVAAFASQDYAGGIAHAGAAAAWAAVGVVAGSVGAGIGAFGGGGGGAKPEGATSREMADRDRTQEQGGGTTVINVFPGGFVTRDEVSAGVFEAINYGARNGRVLDQRALRR